MKLKRRERKQRMGCIHRSNPPTHPPIYREMAQDLLFLLDSQGIDKCVVVGHSMGGKVAAGKPSPTHPPTHPPHPTPYSSSF